MRLSVVFELLLICLLIAFSAYARVIEKNVGSLHKSIKTTNSTNKQHYLSLSLPSLKQAEETMNKHCSCNDNICQCCREFHIPLIPLSGPGCASLQYLQEDNLQVQLSYGNNVLTSRKISGKNPKPICVNLPGGYSKFCGKIYSIKKEADQHFKACLGLELQSSNELEASLRVSCFRFGPEGLKLRPAEEFPPVVVTPTPVDDDDDDDLFGLGDDDDDEDDDEDEDEDDGVSPTGNNASNPQEEEEEDDEDDDVLGFEALLDIFTGDDDTTKKPKVTTTRPTVPAFTIPFLTTSSAIVTPEANVVPEASPSIIEETIVNKPDETNKLEAVEGVTAAINEETSGTEAAETATETIVPEPDESKKPESSEQVELETVKPVKVINKVKKGPIKSSITSTSANAIISDVKKPIVRPSTPDPAINDVVPQNEQYHEEDDDDEDEDDILGAEDSDEEDEDDEKDDSEEEEDEDEDEENEAADENEDTKDEELEEELDDDDDDDEDEEEISALVEGETNHKTKSKKIVNKNKISDKINETGNKEEDDADYGYSLAEILARQLPNRSRGRESKVMRL